MGRRMNQNKIQKEILQKILRNKDLLKYIEYPLSPNPLLENDIEKPKNLINKSIYTAPKNSETIKDENIILIARTLMKPCRKNSNFRNILILFDIIANINCINNLENGDNRILCIAGLIEDSIFDSKGESWLGKVEYTGDYEGMVTKNFTKLQITFEIVDFAI